MMSEHHPTGPDVSCPDRPRTPSLLPNRSHRRMLAAGALVCAAIGLSACGTSSTTGTSPSATPAGNGAGSNARSGPAAGGASGIVGSVSISGFTLATATGQMVTVAEAPSTTYQQSAVPTSASAVTSGKDILVLGTVSGTTITATQVILQPPGGGAAPASAAGVIPFQPGAPSSSKQAGQIPANYSQGSGTIVSGTAANKATEAALAAYPGGIVDRVVQLSSGEYEVHYIGVNWPHHIFVNQVFKVVGAN